MIDEEKLTCDCGSENVTAEVLMVSGRKRIAFICGDCKKTWANTEASVGEAILTAYSPVGRRWTQ